MSHSGADPWHSTGNTREGEITSSKQQDVQLGQEAAQEVRKKCKIVQGDPLQMAAFFHELESIGGRGNSQLTQFLSDQPNPGNRERVEAKTLP